MEELKRNSAIDSPKKAFELSYALFRVASSIDCRTFAETLEEHAIKLLNAVISENHDSAIQSISAISYFVRLGGELNFISFKNCQTLERETALLNSAIDSAIAELSVAAKIAEPELESMFSKEPVSTSAENDEENPPIYSDLSEETASFDAEEEGKMSSAIRQSAILERIRQGNHCRIKELQEFLPDVSERTLRYDLQRLSEQGLVEKVGTSGPSTFYQTK